MGNGTSEEASRVGSYQLKLHTRCILLLHDVLYVPGIQHNLLSVLALLNLGYIFHFSSDRIDVFTNGILVKHGFCLIIYLEWIW